MNRSSQGSWEIQTPQANMMEELRVPDLRLVQETSGRSLGSPERGCAEFGHTCVYMYVYISMYV